ncbi:MAG: lectin-like protein [archaeon]|nr:lectin-like protein [archaeon]MDA1130745.1 lectin-like protein [archaeon]
MDAVKRFPSATILVILLFSSLSPLLAQSSAENSTGIELLHTAINPSNNNTYYLLSEGSWTDSAEAARGLGGFLVTVDDGEENDWLFDTFASFDNQTRHLWIGLSDADDEGNFRWHDGTPFFYRSWGEGQPGQGGDEDYVHITGTNMGNIQPGDWNDLEDDPQYFPVYGVVEVGPGADYALRFDGINDYVEAETDSDFDLDGELTISADVYPYNTEGTQFIAMLGDYGYGIYLDNGHLAYADEYSLSKHPVATNTVVPTMQWSNVAVALTEGQGGSFFIDGQLAGTFDASQSNIPAGDFGSNSCFEAGLDCDEFIIGKMGAGCDCNFFEGLIDNVRVDRVDYTRSNNSNNETGNETEPGNESGDGNNSGGTLMFTAEDTIPPTTFPNVHGYITNETDDWLVNVTLVNGSELTLSSISINLTNYEGIDFNCSSEQNNGLTSGCIILTEDDDLTWSVGETLTLAENGSQICGRVSESPCELTITISNDTGVNLATLTVTAEDHQGQGQGQPHGNNSIVSARNSTVQTLTMPEVNVETISFWSFPEGLGDITVDHAARNGTIHGASWVMPDGTIVAQAEQLFNGHTINNIDANAGDQLLFFATLPEYTRSFDLSMWTWKISDDGQGSSYTVYVGHNSVPSAWDHYAMYESEWGYLYDTMSWPEQGVWWFVVVANEDLEDMSLSPYWEVAEAPPSLDEMTQLNDGIAVTGQSIEGSFWQGDDEGSNNGVLYYYVNVSEPLSDLRIKTYGGQGNADLAISYGGPPDPFDQFINFDFLQSGSSAEGRQIGIPDDGSSGQSSSKEDWSSNQGNNEEVHLYDVEVGTYYVIAYTYRRTNDFTIIADFTYPPENLNSDDAIELFPGVEYGPMSGYDGLDQFFKINVPTGTERLEVDLFDGVGEAELFMRHESAPTPTTFDISSNAPGAGDKIGFNDPTPGVWYILLDSEYVFSGVSIVADFKARYIWSYDGTPIELFNNEEIAGIEAPKGEELFFFLEVENPGEYLKISTYGGEGTLSFEVEGQTYSIDFDGFDFDFDFDDEEGRQGRPNGNQGNEMDLTSEDIFVESNGDGTSQSIMIWNPSNGRFDITLFAVSDISDVSIIATWVESELPPIEPPIVEPVVIESCKESAEITFKEVDTNGDGIVSLKEFEVLDEDLGEINFDDVDINSDGEIEFAEAVQKSCSCDNELLSNFEQLTNGESRVSIEDFSALVWINENNFLTMDVNNDGFVDFEEVEIASLLCETTFSAFDSDGDGVVDGEDAFPEDPDESVDSDGDGVGDNGDFAPSVANDLLYATGGAVLLVLAGLLLFFLKGGMGGSGLVSSTNQHWDDESHSAMQDEMLGLNDSVYKEIPQLDGVDSENPFTQPIDQVVSTPFGEQPTSFEPLTSAAQNTAASEASSELLGTDSQQAPQNINEISEVLDDLFN